MPLSTRNSMRIILMTILLFHTSKALNSAIRYSRYTDVHHSNQVKSDKIEITNKSDQKTRNHVSPLIKQDVSSVPKEKMADTLLSLETRGREEYLHKELLFADTPSVPSPTNVQLRFINASAVLITWAYPPDPSLLSPAQFLVQVSHDGDPYQNSSDLLNVTEFVYLGMKYSAYYQFKVIAYQEGVASSPTETNYFLNGITAPPGPPVNVMAIVMSYSVIDLQWDTPLTPSPLLYIIYWGTNKTKLDNHRDVTQSTHISFKNLEPGQIYFFQLVADIGSWKSIPSPTVNATTYPPNLPAVVLQGNVSNTWIQLSWSDPPSNRYPLEIDGFHIYYDHLNMPLAVEEKLYADNFTNSTMVNGTERGFNLTDLEPGKIYVVIVAYSSGRFLSCLSDTLQLETLERVLCSACDPVSSTELRIKWKVITSLTGSRTLDVFQLIDGVISQQVLVSKINVTATDGELVIGNLHPWTGYSFAVSLETTFGDPSSTNGCPVLNCWTKQAAPSKPPTHIIVSQITSRSVSVEWSQPPLNAQNGLITDYTIVYLCNPRTVKQVCNTMQIEVPADRPSNLTLILNQLTPYTVYSIIIAARTQAGTGPYSFKHTVITDSEAPDLPPANITVNNETDSSFYLSWSPPPLDHQNGIIISYSVSVISIDNLKTAQQKGITHDDVILNVNGTETVVDGLMPLTTYMVTVAAETKAGLGPFSVPLNVSTLKSEVRRLFAVNFTVDVIAELDSFNDHYCFILELEWAPIITANHTLTQLNTSNVYAVNWSYVIYYQATTNTLSGNITLGDNPLSTNVSLSQFNESVLKNLVAGLNYSFWLQADVYLSNGTHLIVKTQRCLVTLPQCQSAAGESIALWEVILLSCVGALVAIGVLIILTVCCGCSLHRWSKRRRHSAQPVFLMDNFVPPDMEENDYLLDPSLRVSDGRSSVSSSTEDERTRVSSESGSDDSPLSLEHSDSDSDLISFADETHPLSAFPPTLASGATNPGLGMPTHAPWPRNRDGFVPNLDSPVAEWHPPSVLPLAPRQNPDGCSLSSSSSSESISQPSGENC